MAHQQQINFCLSVKKLFPTFFYRKLVLDIGSLDINGNNQYLFDECNYLGIDLLPGKNVDIASKGHEINLPDACIDTIISTECFEHDSCYHDTILNIVRMLKPGGLFIFSCATTGRLEHGTRRTTPQDAPFTQHFGDWGDYYKNLEEADIRQVFDVDEYFLTYSFSSQHETHDLYFWGIKRGEFVERNNYSFLLAENCFYRTVKQLELDLQQIELQLRQVESERDVKTRDLSQTRNEYKQQEDLLAKITTSKSWRLTRPLRLIARLMRGEFSSIFDHFLPNWKNLLTKTHIKNGFSYILRGDWQGLKNRFSSYKKDILISTSLNTITKGTSLTWGIMTPGHTLFIAHTIAERLQKHGWSTSITTSAPTEFSYDFYVVICPQTFSLLPPGEKRIVFQLEQSVSSRWFSTDYCDLLRGSLAVLEYSLTNINFLITKGIIYPHVYYLPIGASETYGLGIIEEEKKYDVIFYGDSLSSPRRRVMLNELRKHVDVLVINDMFGEDMIRVLKQARVVVNIHYYENALLETPRIQECLSLGLRVVSETAHDQEDYPELYGCVTFFKEGSIEEMISSVLHALNTEKYSITTCTQASEKRFNFMFDRFLVGMGFLPATQIKNTQLPLPQDANIFALSLPETIARRQVFQNIQPKDCVIFDGIRRTPGWVGCGLSYAMIAHHALINNLNNITVMEDDVLLPQDYLQTFPSILKYLETINNKWDVFAGVIAVLHPETQILGVDEFEGKTFITINKMTSMVFNVYSRSALEMFDRWDSGNLDAESNTIDKYLEKQQSIRVVTTLPYFVGHREEVYSTLWGFQNTRYVELIKESELSLIRKVEEFRSRTIHS